MYPIIEYLLENKIEFINFLQPSDVINLEKSNLFINSNIPECYWLDMTKKFLNSEELIEYPKFYQLKVSNNHKITISNSINLKKLTYFLENDR
jgi:hypothetical protein